MISACVTAPSSVPAPAGPLSCQGMVLDTLQSRERQIALLDRYGALLTEHQRGVMDLHLRKDWSLSEVARHQETSRAAVHDLLRRATAALQDYEERLGLLAERERLARDLADIRRRLASVEGRL